MRSITIQPLIAILGVRAFPRRMGSCDTAFSPPPRTLAMASAYQGKRGRDDGQSALDADIQDLNRAMDTCNISSAQNAFDSAGALLTAIKVRPLLSRDDKPRVHPYAGLYGQRTRFIGSRAILR